MKTVIKIVLALIIVGLSYLVYESIMTPVRFDQAKNLRYDAVVQKLKDIRDIERFFRAGNKRYTANWDSLVAFARIGQIPVIKMVADPTDTTFSRSITDTIGFISVYDSLFGKRQNFRIEDISIVPGSNGQKFEIHAGKIDKGGMFADVYEVLAHNNSILAGLDEQLVRNLNKVREDIDKYPGLKIGSMVEVTTDGNWE
ncbi:MAG TPA: hypothetical protein DCR43_03115 [Bacteroidales bacterium]|nr:MAG: hypothetical protein A2X11_13735 [Bacteroidetes bacterium GWE2_42_24]OFY30119.1 MAG: hypothetical protein A2X09_14040 [Bacteroidetes bacterium GWF2_43_11]PKP27518.1 MAG: hypothetical protein CVU06_01785 [Bacteroidetes bacterium HGW-Bacteroidetes-22]HAQ64833.1 hypothetical protein [Bacteroidales bacterium]HBZ67930.1 hypothetical protein [Bacteroidales bacterium]